MKSMRTPIAALVAFAALALAACGGSTNSSSSSGGGSIPESASFTPAAAAFFVSLDTDTSGLLLAARTEAAGRADEQGWLELTAAHLARDAGDAEERRARVDAGLAALEGRELIATW